MYLRSKESILTSFDLCPLVKLPTRVTDDTATCLDNFITNIPDDEVPLILNLDSGLSDHHGQVISINQNCKSAEVKIIKRRNFSAQNRQCFTKKLENKAWENVFNKSDVNEKTEIFYQTFLKIFNESFPIKTLKKRHRYHKKWITKGIKTSLKTKRELYKISKYNKEPVFIEYFKKYKHVLKIVIRNAKIHDNKKRIMNADPKYRPKATWNVINENTGRTRKKKKKHLDELKIDSKKISEPTEIADTLNIFLQNVASQNQSQSIRNPIAYMPNIVPQEYFEIVPTSVSEVVKVIKGLNNTKSTGWDDIPLDIIKENIYLLALPLVDIFNLSIKSGVFPEKFKISKICPLFKKGEQSDPKNYRPIALLPTFSKILEKLIKHRLMNYLQRHNILVDEQYGFKPNNSTSDAVSNFLHSLYNTLAKKLPTIGIFCDLTKAFENLNILLLICKLEIYGVHKNSLKWFTSYLTERYQYVTVTREEEGETRFYNSDRVEVLSGVPTGSILGPLLFLIYINDLVMTFPNLHLTLYADDTSILVSSENTPSLIEKCKQIMRDVYSWFDANNLTLNDKTVFIDFGTKNNTNKNIDISNLSIKEVQETKFLGILINRNMEWKPHINALIKRLNSALFAIRSTRYNIDESSALLTYHALFMSLITYGIEFWGNDHSLNDILILQKKALRIIYNLKNRTSCRNVFKPKGLQTVYGIYISRLLILIHKNKEDWYPAREHYYNTRHKKDLLAPSALLNQKSFYYEGKCFYNKLPQDLKDKNLDEFRSNIYQLLLDISPYSKNEFLEYL